MGISYNSSIVKDGLILHLDAGNTRSYPGTPYVECLIVGGGGGGGMDMGGGGGGGGVLETTTPITLGAGMTVTVGAGGWGAPAGGGGMRGDGAGPQPANHQFTIPATDGASSSFGGLTAIGGGHGASSYQGYNPDLVNGYKVAGSGGSGGGMSGYGVAADRGGGAGTPGQGNNGGSAGQQYYSGGGGGAAADGTSATSTPHGGAGRLSSINGTALYWGGGGGGASYSLSAGGNGGIGGGGGGAVGTTTGGAGLNAGAAGGGGSPGAQTNTPGGNGGANTGGGGGGGSHYNLTNAGGNGGSGIVIIRYLGPQNATGGTVTTTGDYTVHTFLSSGTFTPTSPWLGWYNTSASTAGYFVNGPTYSSSNGGCIVFDATNDYCLVPYYANLDQTSTVTLEAWIKYTNAANTVCMEKSSNNTHYQFQVFSNAQGSLVGGEMVFMLQPAASGWVVSGVSSNDGNWHHFVGTYNASITTAKIYKDGVLKGTNSSLTSAPTTNSQPFLINSRSGTGALGSTVALIRIYNRPLSASEVLQNFDATKGRFGL